MLHTGDHAPDFTLETINGEAHTLSQTLAEGHSVLLIFLRHLG